MISGKIEILSKLIKRGKMNIYLAREDIAYIQKNSS